MTEKVLEYIGDEMKKVKYFSLIVDSTPEALHVYQLTVVIRYVLDSGEPCERCLKFLPSLSQEKLNSLAILYIEAGITNVINYDDIIDNFANKKSRKKL